MRLSSSLLVITCLSCSALSPAVGQPAEVPAKSLRVIESEIDSPLTFKPSDEAVSEAPRFVAIWERRMPTPGWSFSVDDLQLEEGRIIALVTETRPDGLMAQVMTPATVKLAIGAIPRGRYVFEIRTRNDVAKKHQPVYAAIVNAY